AMQMGQEKFGMQTMNQSLASLYLRRIITYETAMSVTANPEELIDIIQRHEGTVIKKGASSSAGR
ncbi:MAG: type IV pili twitching motility protein PilT, partial [Candidatus Saccharicenans sp.]|nr:type IV pili twitching motility protein PilT [Candidatus Saccharicenans sp.]